MDQICEVKCCGAFLDASLVTLRCEDEDICLDKVVMDHVKKIEGSDVWINEDILHLVDPLVHFACSGLHESVLLVCPVSCDTFLCNLVHSARADLNLHPDTCVAHESTVESLISIVLRVVDPVTDTVCLISVDACDDREYMVALVSFNLICC